MTANEDIEAARRYHEQTRHSPRSVRESGHVLDWENKPSPFKIYPDLPVVPLPRQFAPLPADTFAALSGPASASGAVDLERLAALLFFSAGVTKTKTYAGGAHVYFRAAPSTGALYQTEAYVVAGDVAGLAAGVYHFGPGDFALRRLRGGDFRGAVAGAAADEDMAARPAILALTGIYWRNTWKYQARGYRHLFWDSGTMLANVFASAAALGLSARAVVGFMDDDVNGLLGIDPEREGALVLVAVGGAARPAPPPPPVETIAPAVVPLSASEVSYPLLVDAYVNSRLVSEAEVLDWRERAAAMAAAAPPPAAPLAPLPPPLMTAGRSLAETIQARGSTREFSGEAIAAEALSSALYHASRGFAADVPPGLVDLYLAIHAVDGVAPGAYVYHPGPHALELIRAGDVRADAAFLCLGQALGGMSSATVFFLADLSAPSRRARQPGLSRGQPRGGPHRRAALSRRLRPALRRHRPHLLRRRGGRVFLARTPRARPPSSSPPSAARRRPIKAHLLRWRPRQHAQRRATTPRGGLRAPPRIWTFLSACAICFVGALGSPLNVERLRLAGCLRAPPRIWTLLDRLRPGRPGLQANTSATTMPQCRDCQRQAVSATVHWLDECPRSVLMKKYYLMAPGPTPVPANVLLAMAQPMIHHRTPEYEALFIEVRAGLKRLFQTAQDVIPFTASGTGSMEAAVVSTLSAGDTVLVLRAGKFGERWEEICAAYGLTVVPLIAPFGETVTADRVAQALREHPEARAVLMQHSESSTGVLHDVKGVAAVTRPTAAILIVDAVSSLGIADLPMDAWGVDVVVAGSQKGLMLPPGLSFCALSDKAWGHVKASRLPKYYFDIAAEHKAVSRNEAHFTPAVSIVVGLREVLRMLEAEGLANVFKRHERLARATRSGVEALGLELFAKAKPEPRPHRGRRPQGRRQRGGARRVLRLAQHHHRGRAGGDEGHGLPPGPHGIRRRLRRGDGPRRPRAGAPRAGRSRGLRRRRAGGPENLHRARVAWRSGSCCSATPRRTGTGRAGTRAGRTPICPRWGAARRRRRADCWRASPSPRSGRARSAARGTPPPPSPTRRDWP